MTIDEFTLSVVASLLAGVILSFLGRIGIKYWKEYLVPIGATFFISFVAAIVIFGVQFAVEKYQEHSEITHVQERIDRYLMGNSPKEYEYGWRIEILKLKPEIVLSLYWPKKEARNPGFHPWNNERVKDEISTILKNEGHPGLPKWYYTVHAIPME